MIAVATVTTAPDPRIPPWLLDCCAERAAGGALWTERPFPLTLDGEPWTAATDRRLLVAVRGDLGAQLGEVEAEQFARAQPAVADLLEVPSYTHAIDVAALLAFVGSPTRRTCSECEGRGVVAHRCDCPRCEATDEEVCEVCEGRRTFRQEGVRLFRALGLSLDLDLLSWSLVGLTGRVLVAHVGRNYSGVDAGLLALDTPDRRVRLMGRRPCEQGAAASELPLEVLP